MKRTLYFMMALALVLGFTQCKKEQVNTPENETKTVNITLNVGGNGGGSRHDINTTTGAVDFKDGDVIYVGDGSTYIGTLTRTDGVFSGPINEPADETEIYFFFVGGLPTTPADLSGQSSFTVDISDQSTKMPVLSCNHVTYYSNTTSYSCMLENQCALVKFTTASTTDPVRVGGLYTVAQIDFASNSITNNGTTGFVALNSKSETEKWAVLLPQTGFEGAEAAIAHVGYTTTIPNIEADAFITGNDAVSISTQNNIVYLDWLTSDYEATNGQTLKGTLGANVQISIAAGATVTLDNASINANGAWTSGNYAGITCLGDATIILKDGTTNTVKGFYEVYPGIQPAEGYTLTIKGGAAGTGKLTASSNGVGAGIGGGYDIPCGNIEIQGGDITANGGPIAAGIGSSSGDSAANCGTITITGGTVTATGGEGAGGEGAAGIGSGFYEASCGTITISGGTVMANGGVNAAGIGSGYYASCGAITISGGTVTATGVERGAGIGSGNDNASCGNITISGGTVSATGGVWAAGIGSGNESASCGTINITGGTVTATGGERAAGIGSGNNGARCGTITITTGVTQVTATKGKDAPDSIGKGKDSSTCGTVTIGGVVYWDWNGSVYQYQNGGDTYLPNSPLIYPQ